MGYVDTQLFDHIGKLIQQICNLVMVLFAVAFTAGKTSLLYLILYLVLSYFQSVKYMKFGERIGIYSWLSENSLFQRF